MAVRYNALSRVLESALQKDSIPNRIVGGHKFFERLEVKDLLAYLQLAENPGFTVSPIPSPSNLQQPAFVRVVNVPKRSIGDKVGVVSQMKSWAELIPSLCPNSSRKQSQERSPLSSYASRWSMVARSQMAYGQE